MTRTLIVAVWLLIAVLVAIPFVAAANSPLLAWRQPVYILAGFAGIAAMILLLFQPLLAIGYLPGLSTLISKRVHRWVGSALVLLIVVHVLGLWITSPPDVIDALLFASPTPFSIWGVIAMWCVFAAALMVVFRRKLVLKLRLWRAVHLILVSVSAIGSVVHAMKIEGTMETISKTVVCVLVVFALFLALLKHYRQT